MSGGFAHVDIESLVADFPRRILRHIEWHMAGAGEDHAMITAGEHETGGGNGTVGGFGRRRCDDVCFRKGACRFREVWLVIDARSHAHPHHRRFRGGEEADEMVAELVPWIDE